jgi:uncharacterized membrane protein (DUF373 family)
MEKILPNFEKYISYALMLIAMVGIIFLTLDLIWVFGGRIAYAIQHRTFEVEVEGRPAAALFFGILLWLEILQSVRVFAKDHSVKLKIILIVGIIAVTRKILLLDMSEVEPMTEFAVAALIVALSLGYFLISKSDAEAERAEQE